MSCVLQIGAGGVGGVVAHKMAKNREVFSRIILASRTLSKCKAIADSIRAKGLGEIEIDSVDADSVESLVALIEKYKPKLVINVALPYQDLSIMEACLRTKTHYLDTANYEHPDSAHFEYKEQWAYDTRFKKAGIFALLGSGFDPGVTNVFCAYAQKHYFDSIESIDILDCNAGDHGYAFATNFNPEINLREVSSKARYWVKSDSFLTQNIESKLVSNADLAINSDLKQDSIYRKFERDEQHWRAEVEQKQTKDSKNELANEKAEAENPAIRNSKILDEKCGLQGKSQESCLSGNDRSDFSPLPHLSPKAEFQYAGGEWRDVAPLALMKEWNYPGVGVKNSYLLYHEELESLIRNIKGLQRIRFFMTFGESYLTHMKCLENIGFLRIDEVEHKGQKIVPLEVLKTLLPDPASLASRTKGQTHIGCYITGLKNGKKRTIYIYNICDHEECYKEVNAQGVSYTTGVPAMIGAKLICENKWGVGTSKIESGANNSDMPQGGEYQGIDNAAEIACNKVESAENQAIRNSKILDEKCGLQGKSQGSYPSGNDRSDFSPLPHLSPKAEFQGAGVWNMEQNNPDFFMQELNKQGLPYVVAELSDNGEYRILEDGRNI